MYMTKTIIAFDHIIITKLLNIVYKLISKSMTEL